MRRAFELLAALAALVALAPLLAACALAVWLEDGHSPLYRGRRVARGGGTFRMVKFRSMAPDAWKAGVNSTSASDPRITRVGRWLRALKLDELPQLWNVLAGDMSLVGPRPQVAADAALYTAVERPILDARPGITDLASIVFADEGEILNGSDDPDLLYNQIIRPWKSRLALKWLGRSGFGCDLGILCLTAMALVSRERALDGVDRILDRWGADDLLRRMARRREPLLAYPPPGAAEIVRAYSAVAAKGSA